MTPQVALRQINDLTISLVELSLSNEQNFPATEGQMDRAFEISFNNAAALTIALKNIAYRDIYSELEQARCFNIKMIAGALITLRYRFLNGQIAEHTLSFFPSPDLEHFQNDPDVYLSDDIYADVIARNIVTFPIRFDFNADPERFVDVHHPYSHLTLGQYKNCRIPVCSPLGPLAFGGFILRNFYNTAFRKYSDSVPVSEVFFNKTITDNEKRIPHLICGS